MLTLMTLPTTVGGWIGFVAIIVVIAVLLGISIYTTIRLVKTGHMNEIKDAIAGAVAEAEKTHKTGAEKKEIAMNAMKVYCEKIDWQGSYDTSKVLTIASPSGVALSGFTAFADVVTTI